MKRIIQSALACACLLLPVQGWAALAKVKQIATADSAWNTTHSFTVPVGGVAQGNFAVARGVLALGSGTLDSCADSRSNTYTVNVQVADSTNVMVAGICSAYMTTALQSGDTITMTFSSGSTFVGEATEFSSTATSSILDKTASQVTSFGTAYSSTSTASTTQADELLIGLCGVGSDTRATPGANWNEEADFYGTNPSRGIVTGYRIVAATSTYAFDGTYAASTAGPCMIATYKAAAGAAAVNRGLMMLGVGQ